MSSTAPGTNPRLRPKHYLPAPSSVSYTVVPDAEHELWHPRYLQAIKTALDRFKSLPAKLGFKTSTPKA